MRLFFKCTGCLPFLLLILSIISCSSNNERVQEEKEGLVVEKKEERKTILFFGNSLTAGYGIEEEDAFPGLIQDKMDSLGLEYDVINGGLSGETSASGINRLDWFLEEEPHVFVLELGGNDGLRGIAIPETKKNLQTMIQFVRDKYPDTKIILAGMQIPPNMGQPYSDAFKNMYQELAEEEEVTFIPFLLEGVGGDPGLNLPDGIHPTEEGHRIIAETVWEYLYPML